MLIIISDLSRKIFRVLPVLFLVHFSYAQNERPTIASGRALEPIIADGVLDEPSWDQAPLLTEFRTTVPVEGGTPSKKTEVRIITNEKYIVFGVWCEDDPSLITSFSKLRDANLRNEDYIRIVIDPFQDGQSGYVFSVNPKGARYDALVANRGEWENRDWDGIWEAGTTVNDSGWTAEIKIPIQSINFNKELRSWGLNIERNIQRNLEKIRWANVSRDQWFTQTSRAGLLTDLPEFDYGLGLNITPSLIGGYTNEINVKDDYELKPSLTVSQRLSANAIATATFNTDFAETEVDSRRVNLTRFPLFFPEKRAFFLEGSDIFEFGYGMDRDVIPFFSRRIGLIEGNQVPIIAGGKVNGRINRTSFGGLAMYTGQKTIIDEEELDTLRVPDTSMGVFRVKQNVLKESSFGIFGTVGDPQGRSGAYVVGTDFTYQTTRFQGNKNLLAGVWGLYNDRVDLVGDKSSYGFKLAYPNDIWDVSLAYKHIGDGFDPSIGFVPRLGINKYSGGLVWAPRPKWKLVRQMRHELFPTLVTDLAGEWQSYRIFTSPLNWRFESGERIEFNIMPSGERLTETFEISDGVIIPVGAYEYTRFRLEGEIAAKRKLNGRLSVWFGPFFDGNLSEYQARLNWNPMAVLTFELSGTRNIASLPWGSFDQTLVGFRVRFNFTPDLQLNSFIQYDTDSQNVGINSRIRWIFNPQGDFFFVFNNTAFYDEPLNVVSREVSQVLMKVRYTFRL